LLISSQAKTKVIILNVNIWVMVGVVFLKKKESKCLSMFAFHKFKTWFPNWKHTIEIYSKKLCGGRKPLQQDEETCSMNESLVAMTSTK
jgi:hypothetical protein